MIHAAAPGDITNSGNLEVWRGVEPTPSASYSGPGFIPTVSNEFKRKP